LTRYLIDSDCAIFATTGQYPALRERMTTLAPGELGLSAISYAEIVFSMAQGKPPTQEALDLFVAVVPILGFETPAALAYANLPFKRARFDRLLAAHALSIDAIVVTNNEADFADVPGLKVENWTV
jgi:tRNA(fMet)-specific endonuclease VapC